MRISVYLYRMIPHTAKSRKPPGGMFSCAADPGKLSIYIFLEMSYNNFQNDAKKVII